MLVVGCVRMLTLFILGYLVQPGNGGGGRNQPYGHKIVNNALWKMPFGTIIDIHKMSQKNQKNFARHNFRRQRRRR